MSLRLPQIALALAVAMAVLGTLAIALFGSAFAGAEVVQKGTLRVTVSGNLSPRRLPRTGTTPIAVSVGGSISTTDNSPPPKLKTLSIELNRNGRLDYVGLPLCPYAAINTASSARALSACRSSLVGEGTFDAEIALAGQVPYPISGRLLAFNGRQSGKPVLFGQIYAPHPFATSFVIVFTIKDLAKGTYGTMLSASLPPSLLSWGNLTGIAMTLSRRYSYRGRTHSYLSAGCPAPEGFPGATFPFARTTYDFAEGPSLSSTLVRGCQAG